MPRDCDATLEAGLMKLSAACRFRGWMFWSFSVLTHSALLVFGTMWCREMLGRWRRDLEEFRSTQDQSARLVLALLWVVTALVCVALSNSLLGLIESVFA